MTQVHREIHLLTCISGRFFTLAHALAIAYVATSQPFRDREKDHPKGSKGYRDWKQPNIMFGEVYLKTVDASAGEEQGRTEQKGNTGSGSAA